VSSSRCLDWARGALPFGLITNPTSVESIHSVCNAKMCRQDWKKNFTKKENCSLRISHCIMRQDCTPGGTDYTLLGCILQSDIWVAYEESQFITQRWFLYSLGMGIPQTMKAPTHLQVFCAESWGFRCVRYFLGCWLFCKLKLLHSIFFKGIKSEKQIYSGNLVLGTWEVVTSLSLSLVRLDLCCVFGGGDSAATKHSYTVVATGFLRWS
jgi:hypothetical protein